MLFDNVQWGQIAANQRLGTETLRSPWQEGEHGPLRISSNKQKTV